tara:strand:- start:170 stop:547 length:378 start_codon:yes stop_codon:yes gene_type:complete
MAKLGQYGHQLHTMTAQEVLDVGVEHLLTQMEKSVRWEDKHSTACLYDGGDVCCGAAPFIKDAAGFNHKGLWRSMVSNGWASENHAPLISQLQAVHDDYDVVDWASQLKELATKEGLVYNGEQYE